MNSFDQKKPLRHRWSLRRFAQHQIHFRWRGGFFLQDSFCIQALTLFVLGVFFTLPTFAQVTLRDSTQINKQTTDQIAIPNTQFDSPQPPFIPEQSFWDLFSKNVHGGYSVSLMGSRLNGNSNETYNIYLQDVAPVQLFHGARLSFKVNPDLELGISQTAVQNLFDGVVGNTGNIYNSSFIWYDPTVFANLPNLIKINGWRISTTVSLSLSVTQASQDVGKITSLDISQNWGKDTFPSNWSYGLMTDTKMSFYTSPLPSTLPQQTFMFAITPYVGYRISSSFSLQLSGNFDWEHRIPNSQGFFDFDSNLPDTGKISCSITPPISGLFLSIGGYIQDIFWNPDLATTIVGGDFSIGF